MFSILTASIALYFLFYILKQRSIDLDLKQGLSLIINSPWNVILVLLLVPLNWFIETYKWKYTIQKLQFISWSQAMKSVLAGMFLNLFTPNRIGELGGRLLFIEKENRAEALYINTLCGISQLLITSILGLLAVYFSYSIFFQYIKIPFPLFSAILIAISIILLLVFFKSKLLLRLLILFKSKRQKLKTNFEASFKLRLHLFLYSFLRYLVFACQFFLLLQYFEPEINIWSSSRMMALLFLGTTWIPSGWMSDLPIRGSLAYLILEAFGYSGIAGLFTAVYLWMFNLFLPSLFSILVLPTMTKIASSKIRNT